MNGVVFLREQILSLAAGAKTEHRIRGNFPSWASSFGYSDLVSPGFITARSIKDGFSHDGRLRMGPFSRHREEYIKIPHPVGTKLYVQEDWYDEDEWERPKDALPPYNLGGHHAVDDIGRLRRIGYVAGRDIDFIARIAQHVLIKPAKDMPAWASRFHIEITDVFIQNLHEISDDDAVRDGFLNKHSCRDSLCLGLSHETSPKKSFVWVYGLKLIKGPDPLVLSAYFSLRKGEKYEQ